MAVLPVAAAAIAAKAGSTVGTSDPVIWHFLGYPFEAACMIAAIFGCVSARLWIGAGQAIRKAHLWSIDLPVSGMATAMTAALVVAHRPTPLYALLIGAGLGVLGEGVFKLAEQYLQRFTGGMVAPSPPDLPSPPARSAKDVADVGDLLKRGFGDPKV